ncbi:hypothetical protein HY990_00690 [Candidatus Micrarchaeota archaeon]|nr:hypothetical protein [Candidatus Micrarchaeota archaeon]
MAEPNSNLSTSSKPQVDGFKLAGSFKTSPKEVSTALRSISFLEIAPEKSAVNVVYVESKDINKMPYLFSLLKFKENELEVIYSIPAEIGPRKRRMDVISYLLNLLSLVSDHYQVDTKAVYQLLEQGVKDIVSSVSMDYNKLYTTYDSLKKESEDIRKKVARLNEQNQALLNKNFELKSQNDELRTRLSQLETLSDDVLKSKLQQWISEHSGSISVIEFSKLYQVPEGRVEELLNRLVNEGYLSVVQ